MIETMPTLLGSNSCIIGKINISVGSFVKKGQALLQLETKKGNREIKATADGIIKEILVKEGEEIFAGKKLFELDVLDTKDNPIENEFPASLETTKMSTELLIIGGGTGGYVAAIFAAKRGKKVTLIEKDKMGGTCLNRGCIPTKALIASSHKYKSFKRASEFGINLNGKFSVNMSKVIKRKDAIVDELKSGIEFLMEKNQITVIKGKASFLNNNSVCAVGDKTYEIAFDDCIVATGSEVFKPNITGIDLDGLITSDEAIDLQELPDEITVVGGGAIGLEFAFLYNNFGVKVYVIELLEKLVASCDSDVSASILKLAKERGIEVFLGAKATGFRKSADGKIITDFETNKKNFVMSDKVLIAIGRRPYITGLGLENTDIELNGSIIKVDKRMCTSVEHIYAVGDVNNLVQLAHGASYQGIIAVSEILGRGWDFDKNVIPSLIFTSPEVGTIGITEDEAIKLNIKHRVGKFSFSSNGKALTLGEPEGYVKLIEDENGIIIGGTLIGADASSLLAIIGLAVKNKLKSEDIAGTVFEHPTTSEVIGEAANALGLGAIHE